MKKRKISRNIVGVIFSIIICITGIAFSCTNKVYAVTQSEFDQKMSSLRSKYPNYSTWTGTFNGGKQCYGFAHMIGNDVFGSLPSSWTKVYSIDSVKVGDLIQYGNTSGSGHTIFVTGVSGNTITFLDCNGNGNYSGGSKVRTCGIKWDNTIQKNAKMFKKYSFSYLLSSPGISPDIQKPDTCNCSESYAGNYIVTTSQLPLTIRSGHGGSYGKVGSIPKGTTVYVSKANGSWAHVTYNGVSGYCSMEYLSKQEPAVEEGWVDIGTNFFAKIINTSSGKMLTNNNDDVRTYSENGDSTQIWKFHRLDDGSYWIINISNGKALDVYDASSASGTNVQTWEAHHGDAQRWFIYGSQGNYSLRPACAPSCRLDVQDGFQGENGNIWIYEKNDSGAQKFTIQKTGEGTIQAKNVGEDFYAYIINTAAGKHLTSDGSNVTMRNETGKAEQVWHFQKQSDNSYKITSCLDGNNLDVYDAGTTDGTNLQVYWDNGNNAQRWYIYGESGAYYFRARCGELVIDIPGGSTADGENVHMWTYNGGTAQKFQIQGVTMCNGVSLDCSIKTLLGRGNTLQLTGTVSPSDASYKWLSWSSSNTGVATVDANGLVTAVGEGSATITARTQDGSNVSATCQITVLQDQNVGDDFYAYITNIAAGKHLTNDGINVSMRSDTGKADQVWHFQRQSDNSYKVISCLNGKILDVANAGRVDGTNLDVYESNETWAQRWYICGEQESYCFRAQCGELVINIPNGSTADGENVQMWTYNGGSAQQFSIQKVNMCSGVTLDYSNKTLLGIGVTTQLTGAVLPADATNKALFWSSSNTAVATVDSKGLVTAIGAGNATIVATTQDGSNVSATCDITVCELLKVTGKASLSEVIAGNSVTITATASGGKVGYTYSFLIHNLETDKWFRVAEFGNSGKYIWTASGSGAREFFVEAKDSTGTVVRSEAIKVTVKAKSVPLSVSGKVSTSEVTSGKTVTISASAIGGAGDYTYSFLIHNLENNIWYRWPFDKNAEHVWIANGSGSREFFAEVKDGAGTVVRSSAMKVTVKSATTPLAITGKVSASQVAAGKTVTISASATGGTGSYTYSFLIHNLENDTWYRWSFDKSAEHVWKASGSGSREFFAEVKDAAGTVVRSAAMKVTVGSGSNTEPLRILASADKTQVTTGLAVTISALAVG